VLGSFLSFALSSGVVGKVKEDVYNVLYVVKHIIGVKIDDSFGGVLYKQPYAGSA
jgi:hypothetical protein